MPKDTSASLSNSTILEQMEAKRTRPDNPWIVPITLIVVAIVFFVLSEHNSTSRRGTDSYAQLLESGSVIPRLVPYSYSGPDALSFVEVKTGSGDLDDLFLCDAAPQSVCQNLTESPAISEFWPVLDAKQERIAYYGAQGENIDIYMYEFPSRATYVLSLRASQSGLHTDYRISPISGPLFSPTADRLIFLGENVKDKTREIFAVSTDGHEVIRITDLGNRVINYDWLDDVTLLFTTQRLSDDVLQYWFVVFDAVNYVGPQLIK